MGLAPVTVEGRLAADPELRFTPSGAAVANFRIAHTDRKPVPNTSPQQWEDGETIWFGVSCWRDMAENVTESLRRGDLVIVHGNLKQETYTTQQNEVKVSLKIEAKYVGPSLSRARVTINRTERQQGQPQPPQGQQDPWATPPQGQQQQGQPQQGQAPTWGSGYGGPGYQQGNPPANQPNPNAGQGGWGQQPSYGEPPF